MKYFLLSIFHAIYLINASFTFAYFVASDTLDQELVETFYRRMNSEYQTEFDKHLTIEDEYFSFTYFVSDINEKKRLEISLLISLFPITDKTLSATLSFRKLFPSFVPDFLSSIHNDSIICSQFYVFALP